jgi:hypothetical protein
MLVFRSEEHVERWLASGEHPDGARMTIDQQWDLARRWFAGRDRPEWTKRSAEQAHEIFEAVGLTGDFWRLT